MELVEQRAVRAVGHQQRAGGAVRHVQPLQHGRPQLQTAPAHREDRGVGVRVLAHGSQHRRRRVGRALGQLAGRALVQRYLGAAFRQAPADQAAHQTGAGDLDPHWR